MNRFQQEVITELTKSNPCKASTRKVCEELNDNGLACSIRKSGNKTMCVSKSGEKEANEERFDEMRLKVLQKALLAQKPQMNILDFRKLVHEGSLALKQIEDKRKKIDMKIAMYTCYIVNATYWNDSVKVAITLMENCDKSLLVGWFDMNYRKDDRKRVSMRIKQLAQEVLDKQTTACLTNHNENFDFDNACFTDAITQECLEKKVVVNGRRKTEKGYMTECYNIKTAKKLTSDPYTREPFDPFVIDRPKLVEPIKVCKRNMSKEACETFCREQRYTDQKLARCLIPNKHWSHNMTAFQKVRQLLQYKS